jgi:galactonate dehydratase
LQITKIEPFFLNPGVAKNLLFCRVDTDEGVYGWGEAYVVQGKEKSVASYITEIAPYLIGRSPFHIKHTARVLYDDYIIRRISGDFMAAWSAIEIAMWDIVGKYTNQPVYNLLGGPCRERIRVYANGWYDVNFGGNDSPEGMAERALRVKEMGFSAMKWDPFMRRPWRYTITRQEEDEAVACVKAVRKAVGDEVDLLIEVHRRLSPYCAAHFAERIEEFKPMWFEEPCVCDNVNLVAEAKKKIRHPVVNGETRYSLYEFRDILEKNAAEILNPDVCAVGGISGTIEIATMAEPYNVLVSPHNYNSTAVALAATVQACAAIPNFLITEYFLNVEAICKEVVTEPLKLDNGFIDLPVKPGIGIDINMDVLQKHPYKEIKKQFPVVGVAHYYEEFPRKEDYVLSKSVEVL